MWANETSFHCERGYSGRAAPTDVRILVLRILLACLCVLSFSPAPAAAESLRVLTVLSDSSPLYQDFAKTFTQNLPSNIRVTVLQRPEDFTGDAGGAELIVTVGVKATESLAGKSRTPLLAAMIPSHKYGALMEMRGHNNPTTALYVDQPWSRQLALVRAVLPERSKVGLLYSKDAGFDFSELRKEAQQHHVTLVEMPTRSEEALFGDLVSLLSGSDVLLALPDSKVFNSSTIRNILLESYRHKIPLLGLSQAYVNAGALCAVYSTPEQLAAQVDSIVIKFAQNRRLPEVQFPVLYNVAINQEVMRALGINIRSTEWLHLQIDKMQGGRQ